MEQRMSEKYKETNDKCRNRSKVGHIIQMHELIERSSNDHIKKNLRNRHMIERDSYFKKI